MRLKIILSLIAVIMLAGCNKRLILGGGWSDYDEPVMVELTGKLDPSGMSGGTEQYRLIKLDRPIDIAEKSGGAGAVKKVRKNVTWIQLILNFAAVEFLSSSANEKVWVRGALFQPSGSNAPVQMRVNDIKGVK